MPDFGPQALPASDVEACFSACSRRVIIAAFRAQIREADILGIGTCPLVSQYAAAVERMELALEHPAYRQWAAREDRRADDLT